MGDISGHGAGSLVSQEINKSGRLTKKAAYVSEETMQHLLIQMCVFLGGYILEISNLISGRVSTGDRQGALMATV